MFSPWEFDLDPTAVALLERHGWVAPAGDGYPTGRELVERYLEPLAATPPIASALHLGARVVGVTRAGVDKLKDAGREDAPFELVVEERGVERRHLAAAVIDASGTWTRPNPLGAGLPATGERALGARIAYGGGGDDQLPARGAAVRELVADGSIALAASFQTRAVAEQGDKLVLSDGEREIVADEVIAATGFRPDLSLLGELRLDLDDRVEAPRALAPLIDPNLHSCGSVPPHGVDALSHPDAGIYVVGMKSYGRAPTFLLRTGYEQARSVVAALAGDWEAARQVELVLPETGVCSGGGAPAASACCGSGSSHEVLAER